MGAQDVERSFFRRFSVKFGPVAPLTLASSRGTDPEDPRGPATTLAVDWTDTLQQAPVAPAAVGAWFSKLPRPDHGNAWAALVAPIKMEEVVAVTKSLGRNKACGLDEMPNAWYKDLVDRVAPILVAVFEQCLEDSDLPPSFSQASIYCIPKSANPTSGLGFRPIALLNTDYKLLTRIMATRLAPLMNLLTHRAQNGFVGGRNIHDTIDVFAAVQHLVRLGLAPREAVVLMLDFKKAYDSLDRTYLLHALQWHGLPSQFVALIGRLHQGTTAAFQANGYHSDPVDMHNGIRQGCPLAPMLFVLALDLLFRCVEADQDCPGILVAHTDTPFRVSIAGYEDDVSLFLQGPHEEAAFLNILKEFEAAFGLVLNLQKCATVCLHPNGPQEAHLFMQIAPAPPEQPTRYLGIPVTSAHDVSAAWAAIVRAIQVRTVLALRKTADVLQRCKLAAAVIVPKILYVAKHVWLTASIADELDRSVHNFVWTGRFAAGSSHGHKALFNRHRSQLALADGGVGEPNIRAELRALTASTVATWASGRTQEAVTIGDVLLWTHQNGESPRTTYITPWHVKSVEPSWQASLWRMGSSVLRHVHGHVRDPVERDGITSLLEHSDRLRQRGTWDGGWWRCPSELMETGPRLLREIQTQEHGASDLRWLPTTTLLGYEVLFGAEGKELQFQEVNHIASRTDRVADVLEWRWEASATLSFRCTSTEYPLSTAAADQFRKLCVALVANYPRLLLRPAKATATTPYEHSSRKWTLVPSSMGAAVNVEIYPAPVFACGVEATMLEVEILAGKSNRPPVRTIAMWAHPTLTRVVQLWPGTGRWVSSKKKYKALATSAARATAIEAVTVSSRDLQWRSDRLDTALRCLSWKSIHKIAGSTSQQRRLLLKLKANRLSGWDASRGRRGCPHPGCEHVLDCDTAHIVWECPAAQHVWARITAAWRGLGAWPTAHNTSPWLDSIFSLTFPAAPPAFWRTPHMTALTGQAREVTTVPHSTLLPVWRLQVLTALQAIWRWRHSFREAGRRLTETAVATTLTHQHHRIITDAIRGLDLWDDGDAQARVIVLRAALQVYQTKPQPEPPPGSLGGIAVLFFDGGSRGNPSSGGSGVVLVRLRADGIGMRLAWAGSASLAHPSTTNNIAEYKGLIWGLTAAARHHNSVLHVLGDSALILRQLRTNTPRLSLKLRPLYSLARLLADKIGVASWCHHYRIHNKMADHLANAAMNKRAGLAVVHQPTAGRGSGVPEQRNGSLALHLSCQLISFFFR